MASVPQEHDGFEDEAPPRSTLGLLRNVVLNLTRVVEDSTELIGASVREELAAFRVEMSRQLMSIVTLVIGGAMVTAGLAMFVSRWIGMPWTLLMFGAVYLVVAGWLQWLLRPPEEERWK